MIGSLPGPNPVIAAVEAGHLQGYSERDGLHCQADNLPWPCVAIVEARAVSADRYHRAQQQAAIDAGKLSYLGRT